MEHKPRVSRTRTRIAVILLAVFAALMLASGISGSPVPLYAAFAVLAAATVLILCTSRCPNCGASFRGLRWKKSAGFCEQCGQRIRFDDEPGGEEDDET